MLWDCSGSYVDVSVRIARSVRVGGEVEGRVPCCMLRSVACGVGSLAQGLSNSDSSVRGVRGESESEDLVLASSCSEWIVLTAAQASALRGNDSNELSRIR